MRLKNIKLGAIGLLLIGAFTSCEDYLDKSPDMGLGPEDIYRNFESIRGYFDVNYRHLDNIYQFAQTRNARTHPGAFSDEMASLFKSSEANIVTAGNWLNKDITHYEIGNKSNDSGTEATSIHRAYDMIRISCRVIADIDQVKVITEDQRKGLLGQAYMLRAWGYFQLMKRYGGMPILDKVFVGNGDEDIPRETYHGSHDWMMKDIEKAIELLPEMWDDANQGRANKMAAMAFKAEALLYDASPLMQNDLNSTEVKAYDTERALLAAQAAQVVIDAVDASSYYRLSSTEEYKNIFYYLAPPFNHPEHLWFNRQVASDQSRMIRSFFLPSELAKGTGNDAVAYNAPTQNMVEMYERQGADGLYYPISDERSGYTEEVARLTPFNNRDPRLKNNILAPGDTWGVDLAGNPIVITTYKGGQMANTVLASKETNVRQQTGYLCKKYMWETCNQFQNQYSLNRVITCYIRVAQIYLNYAEAAFEATGSAKAVPSGCTLSAEEALNTIRLRGGITALPQDYVTDVNKFRESYRRERAVELMFENHRWYDLRRWMIAHEVFAGNHPIKNIEATLQNDGSLSFQTIDNTVEQRNFTMRNYWYPFSLDVVASMKKLKQNPGW